MALVRSKNGVPIVVAEKISGRTIGGGDKSTSAQMDWFECVIDTTNTSGDTSNSDQFKLPSYSDGGAFPYNDFDVSWGDGSYLLSQTAENIVHTYGSSGSYNIRVVGPIYWNFKQTGGSNTNDAIKTTDILRFGEFGSWDTVEEFNSKGAFWGCTNLTTVTALDTIPPGSQGGAGGVGRGASNMFRDCTNLVGPLSGLNFIGRDEIASVFQNCTSFNGDIPGPATPQGRRMASFFANCTSFNQNINDWDVSSQSFSPGVFFGCTSFNQPLDQWEPSTQFFSQYFFNCSSFNQDLTNWKDHTVQAGTFFAMFEGATNYNNLGVGGIGAGIDLWNVSNSGSFADMFRSSGFNQEIRSWNVTTATDFNEMFRDSTAFNKDIGNWVFNTSANVNLSGMFRGSVFQNAGLDGVGLGIDNWTTSNVNTMRSMFQDCPFNSYINSWNTSSVTDMREMFRDTTAFDQDITSWDLSSVTTFEDMFRGAQAFNTSLSGWSFKTTGNVSMLRIFYQSVAFTGLGLADWDVSNINDWRSAFANSSANFALTNPDFWELKPNATTSNFVSYMFSLSSFNGGQASGVGGRNCEIRFSTTPGDSYSLREMFINAQDFNQDISTDVANNFWQTDNVTDMRLMFARCSKFNQNISNWNTSNVTNMVGMFDCDGAPTGVFNQPIGSWDMSNITSLNFFLRSQGSFDQDISGWTIASLTSANYGAFGTAFSTTNYDLLLDSTTGWPSQATIQTGATITGLPQYTSGGNAEAGRNILTGTYGWTIADGGPV